MAAHLFAEEINTESDLVGENLATKGDELYFQDLPIYNKLNISSAKVGEKTAKEPQSHTIEDTYAHITNVLYGLSVQKSSIIQPCSWFIYAYCALLGYLVLYESRCC